MNLQEELKVLKQRIAELEELVEREQEIPRDGDDYWYIDSDAEVMDMEWDGSDCDQDRLLIGNVYKTEQQARFVLEKLKVEAELWKFSRPFKDNDNNYYIELYLFDKILSIDSSDCFQTQGTIYFESAAIANEAINSVGTDRIKKYLFGVEG